MEELLPLIIGIVWLVITIYNKGKKKQAKRHSTEENEEVKTPSILEQIFAGNEAFQSQPYEAYDDPEENQILEEYIEVDSRFKEETSPFLNSELAEFVHEGQEAFSSSDNYLTEENLELQDQVEKPDFDLKKAIIFSEILNAPYIGYK